MLVACTADPAHIEDLRTEEEQIVQPQETYAESAEPSNGNSENEQETTNETVSNYSYKVVEGENGWGYQIFDGSTMQINQMHIPSLPGINGFKSQEKAETAAQFIVQEIEKGNFPPTVSPEILDSLGVL